MASVSSLREESLCPTGRRWIRRFDEHEKHGRSFHDSSLFVKHSSRERTSTFKKRTTIPIRKYESRWRGKRDPTTRRSFCVLERQKQHRPWSVALAARRRVESSRVESSRIESPRPKRSDTCRAIRKPDPFRWSNPWQGETRAWLPFCNRGPWLVLLGTNGLAGAGNEEHTCTMPSRTTSKDKAHSPKTKGTELDRYSQQHRSILHFYTKRATTAAVSALFRPDGGVFWLVPENRDGWKPLDVDWSARPSPTDDTRRGDTSPSDSTTQSSVNQRRRWKPTGGKPVARVARDERHFQMDGKGTLES